MFNQRNHSSEIGMLEEMNHKLKDRYEFYKVRLADVSRKSAHFNPKLFPKKHQALQESLKTLQNALEILKKEKESLSGPASKNLSDLEEQKKSLELKIKSIKIENEAIRSRLKQKESSEESIINPEVIGLKKRVAELEAAHEKNLQTIKDLQKVQKEKENSRKSAGKESEDTGPESQTEKLSKLEQNLRTMIKSNENKFKSLLKELETTVEKLNSDKICLQMKILKTTQQERLLQMTLDKKESEPSFADANFLYKPSIKSLYH
jgi:chromosome segregation ATPase